MLCLMCKRHFTPLIQTNPRCAECTIRAAEMAGGDVSKAKEEKVSKDHRRNLALEQIKKV